MKQLLSVFVILLLLAIPTELFAKAETSKIIINGADLSAPIEITDPKTLANFLVWTGRLVPPPLGQVVPHQIQRALSLTGRSQ